MPSSNITFLLIFSLCLSVSPSTARGHGKPIRARALVHPVARDSSTGQYLTTIGQRTPLRLVKLTVDIGRKALWVACNRGEYVSFTCRSALCHSPQCKLAKSKSCDNCWDGPRPGCNNKTCSNVVFDTVHRSAQIGELATDVLAVRSTDGSSPGRVVRIPNFLVSCGS